MKYYTFKRESNNFSDILSDVNIKKYIRTKISWDSYLMIGLANSTKDGVFGYIVLKYGEDICNPIERDYTPNPYIDYLPKK